MGVASTYAIERARGVREARRQLAILREKWPAAFPVQHQDVRPLSIGAAHEISATMGWPFPYTLGVLGSWKMSPIYCQAVLRYDQRVGLDGVPGEAVDLKARDLAAKRLAELSARKPAKAASARGAATEPAPVPKPAAETPEQLRARVRASLLRRSA
jgi:sRNA-binding protein